MKRSGYFITLVLAVILSIQPEFRKAQSRVWVSFFRQLTLLNIVGQFHKRWQKNLFNRAGWEACYAYSLPMIKAGGCVSMR